MILDLPTEILVEIFLLVVYSPIPKSVNAGKGIPPGRHDLAPSSTDVISGVLADLVFKPRNTTYRDSQIISHIQRICTISSVCLRFYSVMNHPAQDIQIWKPIARILGYENALSLENVLRCGDSHTSRNRSWRKAVEVAVRWNETFPHYEVASKNRSYQTSTKSVLKRLPPRPPNGITRTFDLVSPGQGRVGPSYIVLEPSPRDAGKIFAQCVDAREENPRSVSSVYGIISPETSTSRIILRSLDQDISIFDLSLPNQCNLVMEKCVFFSDQEDNGTCYEISRYAVSTGKRDKIWRLLGPPPERYVAHGNYLLALYSPSMVFFYAGSPENPARLRCFLAVPPEESFSATSPPMSTSSSSTSKPISKNAGPAVSLSVEPSSFMSQHTTASCSMKSSPLMWDINLSRDWTNNQHGEQFCVVRNIRMTSQSAIILLHWYPASSMHKLTASSFRILNVETGETKNVLTFEKPDSSPYHMFTTVSDHDFAVTDTHIVSGGPNGELYVWNYHTQRTPLYSIPNPDISKFQHDKESSAPMYSSLCVSTDGKYLAATANNRITIWNMLNKRLENVFYNGRKVSDRDFYSRNSSDNFRTGVWVLYRDWRKKKRIATRLERLLCDSYYVDEHELVSEQVSYIVNPFGECDLNLEMTRPGWLTHSMVSTELKNFLDAIKFWIHWLLLALWDYGYLLAFQRQKTVCFCR